MSKITVLVIEPERKPYVKEIEHTLESLQHEVGGHIQAVYMQSMRIHFIHIYI